MIEKIISGGQTGVDRAALDSAIALQIPHGGWCPVGRRAEDGRIDERYRLVELVSTTGYLSAGLSISPPTAGIRYLFPASHTAQIGLFKVDCVEITLASRRRPGVADFTLM